MFVGLLFLASIATAMIAAVVFIVRRCESRIEQGLPCGNPGNSPDISTFHLLALLEMQRTMDDAHGE